jgi:hypothetical protein
MKQVYTKEGRLVGNFDGEYVYSLNTKTLMWRVDEDEVYSLGQPCKYLGSFDGIEAIGLDGQVLFRVEE